MSNTVRDKECDYGTYANEKRLSDAGIGCTRPGTESVDLNGIAIAVCKEHFEKINSIFGNAFAQKGDSKIPPLVEPDKNISTMAMSTANQSQPKMMNLNGTINVESTIAEAFKSKITTDIIGAIQAAQASIGVNSFVKEAELTQAHGYLVYKIMVVDENMKKYKVIVDPGNGQVLMKKEITWQLEETTVKMGGDPILVNYNILRERQYRKDRENNRNEF